MRLIDADALKSEFEWLKSVVNESSKDEVQDTIQRIENAPTVYAAPVVHGRWEHTHEGIYLQVRCTACGVPAVKVNTERFDSLTIKWAYCPNCGAKMDRKDDT